MNPFDPVSTLEHHQRAWRGLAREQISREWDKAARTTVYLSVIGGALATGGLALVDTFAPTLAPSLLAPYALALGSYVFFSTLYATGRAYCATRAIRRQARIRIQKFERAFVQA